MLRHLTLKCDSAAMRHRRSQSFYSSRNADARDTAGPTDQCSNIRTAAVPVRHRAGLLRILKWWVLQVRTRPAMNHFRRSGHGFHLAGWNNKVQEHNIPSPEFLSLPYPLFEIISCYGSYQGPKLKGTSVTIWFWKVSEEAMRQSFVILRIKAHSYLALFGCTNMRQSENNTCPLLVVRKKNSFFLRLFLS